MPMPNLYPYPHRVPAGFQHCDACKSSELHWRSRKGSIICDTCGKTMTQEWIRKAEEEAKVAAALKAKAAKIAKTA